MPSNPLSDPNWAANLTNTIDKYVGVVRDNATLRVVKLVRTVVFGALAGFAGLVLAVVGIILGVRVIQGLVRMLPGQSHASSVWIGYLVFAALLFGAGAFLMRKRHTS